LVAAAGARDPPRADLAALGDEAPQRADVLVVDVLDLVLAVQAGLTPAAAGPALLVPATCGLAIALLGHLESPRIHRQHRTRASVRGAAIHCGSLEAVGSARGPENGAGKPKCIEPPGVPEGSKPDTARVAGAVPRTGCRRRAACSTSCRRRPGR